VEVRRDSATASAAHSPAAPSTGPARPGPAENDLGGPGAARGRFSRSSRGDGEPACVSPPRRRPCCAGGVTSSADAGHANRSTSGRADQPPTTTSLHWSSDCPGRTRAGGGIHWRSEALAPTPRQQATPHRPKIAATATATISLRTSHAARPEYRSRPTRLQPVREDQPELALRSAENEIRRQR